MMTIIALEAIASYSTKIVGSTIVLCMGLGKCKNVKVRKWRWVKCENLCAKSFAFYLSTNPPTTFSQFLQNVGNHYLSKYHLHSFAEQFAKYSVSYYIKKIYTYDYIFIIPSLCLFFCTNYPHPIINISFHAFFQCICSENGAFDQVIISSIRPGLTFKYANLV